MTTTKRFDHTYSIWWNLALITAGSVLFAVGVKGVAVHHGFLTGGLFGASLLLYYATGTLTPGLWYVIFNIPLFALGWLLVSRRFFFYSLYAMTVITLAYEALVLNLHIDNEIYAAITAGAITGAGGGMILRSLGSAGGLDIVAVLLFQRFNVGVGKFYFLFNLALFSVSFAFMDADLVIATLVLVFVASQVTDYTLSMFSQRKMVLVISSKNKEIAGAVREQLKIGGTFLKGHGAYSGQDKDVLMTVINNIQLKRLEEVVFSLDEHALFIVENTFNVLGSGFSRRKIY